MEKLIELLNEYGTQKQANANWKEFLEEEKNQIYLIFGMDFIKWLVENDKIEREKFGNSETKSSKYSDFELSYDTPREDYTNTLLMELSIQDEPIDFLISILN